MKRKVSMRDIGQAVGVSTVTVSKALAGRSGVSKAVREQIVQKAEALGYRYDQPPRLSAETRGDVGILIADHFMDQGTSFYASMCKKLVQQLGKLNCYGVLGILSEEDELSGAYPDILNNDHVKGLVILGQVQRSYIQMLETSGMNVPYICLDFYDERSNADAVVSDGLYGGYRLTSHLIHWGHTRIGFVGSIKATSSIMDRYLGYYRSMLLHDLPIDPSWIVQDRNEHGFYQDFPLPDPLPTAFVCNCDQTALRLMGRLKGLGLRIPEDVSIVGFDDYIDMPAMKPALTTFAVDQDTMAREAAEMITAKMQGGSERRGRVITGGKTIYRESVLDLRHNAGEKAGCCEDAYDFSFSQERT